MTYSLLPVYRPGTHAFFWSHFGDRDGVQGRDGCEDEDDSPSLSQTSDPAASCLFVTSQKRRPLGPLRLRTNDAPVP